MRIRKTLQNPFVLVAQGFVAGIALFLSTTAPDAGSPQDQPVLTTLTQQAARA